MPPAKAAQGTPGALQSLPRSPAAIEADGRDTKALFRRSQALQKLGRLDQAISDLQRCISLEPKNKAFQEALRALGSSMHEKVRGKMLWGGCCCASLRVWWVKGEQGLSCSFWSVSDEDHVLHGLKGGADVPDLAGS